MRTRVVIVGGGLSGLTAAHELSRTPALRARYDVTVYQMGWRLGGKIASGRNPRHAFRNEEHGLHVWFGFYHNAFRLLAELDERWGAARPADFPFDSLLDGFVPESYVPIGDRDGEGMRAWHVHFPRNAGRPGSGGAWLSGWEALTHAIGWIGATLRMASDAAGVSPRTLRARAPWSSPDAPWGESDDDRAVGVATRLVDAAARPLAALLRAGARTAPAARVAAGARVERAIALAMRIARPPLDRLARRGPAFAHMRTVLETSLAFLRGVCSPRWRVLEDFDLDRLNGLDYREFLCENGARRELVDDWSALRGLYDAMFQYEDGDPARPSFEAGTAARILLRAGLLYRGAALWIPRAGLGELVVAPLYDTLRAQGVRVALFHELTHAELSTDGTRVERLDFRVQARATDGAYRPTFVHGGLACWGSAPDWSQLEDGARLEAAGIDLEAPNAVPGVDTLALHAGRDFDHVVLALPLGTLAARRGAPSPCAAIVRASPRLEQLCARACLAPSLSVQLWSTVCFGAHDGGSRALGSRDTPAALYRAAEAEGAVPPDAGVPRHFPAAAFGWSRPLTIWADMRQVLGREAWDDDGPRAAYYLCGTWHATTDDPVHEATRAEAAVAAQLDGATRPWPTFRRDALQGQVLRANVRASDLCDGASVGTSHLRPEPHETHLANLTYCGTWTRTGINSTCVEAAVMSGMAAARAITGEAREIIGEGFLAAPARAVPGFRLPAPGRPAADGRGPMAEGAAR